MHPLTDVTTNYFLKPTYRKATKPTLFCVKPPVM